jgi:hypothetical protein
LHLVGHGLHEGSSLPRLVVGELYDALDLYSALDIFREPVIFIDQSYNFPLRVAGPQVAQFGFKFEDGSVDRFSPKTEVTFFLLFGCIIFLEGEDNF